MVVSLETDIYEEGEMNDAKESLELSRSSSSAPDPLSNVLDVLGARVTRRTRIEAAGQWALSFPGIDRLKFVALLRGKSWLMIPGHAPQLMRVGDVCLIGRTEYAIASDPALTPVDGRSLYDGSGRDVARINGDETIGIGGSVTFSGANADFLLDMLPDCMIVPKCSSGSGAIATILTLMSNEIERDTMGNEIVSARLADVLLVEAIRAYVSQVGPAEIGWLGALLDPRIGRALRALHGDVAHPWTVAELAGVAGMSRAAFSAEFTQRIGRPPLSYLRSWRLTIARTDLMRGNATVADIANTVGYRSQSAFSQAFRRAFGTSPKDDAESKAGNAHT
jgi:AraC-like DNA-binding protein